jgi:hypothetical protein
VTLPTGHSTPTAPRSRGRAPQRRTDDEGPALS